MANIYISVYCVQGIHTELKTQSDKKVSLLSRGLEFFKLSCRYMSINRTDLPPGHAGMALPCFTARDASDGSVQMSLWNASPA